METEKPRNEEVAEDRMGDFGRLPNELLILILNKIDDLKVLCSCTLVSKCFASKIYHIRSVSLKLPNIDADHMEAHSIMSNNLYDLLYFKGEEITPLIQPSIQQKMKIIKFLENFVELESVYLEFACPINPCTSPLLKWKAKLGSCEPMVESFVSILPTSMCKVTENVSAQDREIDISVFQKYTGSDCSFPLTCCSEWLVLIFSLIRSHPLLQSVTCTDFGRHGTLALNDEQIVEWRKRLLLCEESPNVLGLRAVGSGWAAGLNLPVSGYRMKSVSYVLMDFLDNYNEEFLKYLMSWEYSGEERVLGEAVKEIIKEHMDDIF